MKKFRKLAAALTAAVCLSAGMPGLAEADSTITSGDGRFMLTLPEGWEDLGGVLTRSAEDRAFLIRCGRPGEAAYLVFGCESASETVPEFEDYRSNLLKGMTENAAFSDISLSNDLDITLRGTGLRGKLMSFSALYDGAVNVNVRIYALEGVREYYQFCAWTTAERAPEENMIFDRIVNSLRIER